MIRAVIEACLEHRIFTILVVAAICGVGVWAVATIPVDAIPDLSDVQVIIVAEWPGQNPQVMEDQVTYRISSAMLNVAQVKDVRAQSYFGVSFVYVIFEDGTDIYWARSRVLEYLQGVPLPEGPKVRIGPDASGLGWVYMYTLEDTERKYDLGELRAIHDWYVANVLRSVDGVAEVAVVGGAQRRYEVVADPERMLALKVSVPELGEAIRNANRDVGGMSVEIAEREYMVRGRGYVRSTKDLEDIVIRSSGGTPVRVRDMAQVLIGPDSERGVADRNGRGETVAGIVVARHGANARRVIEGVQEAMEKQVKPGLPKGVILRTAYDRTPLIRRAIGTLSEATFQALGMILLVCIVFLLHARSAVVAFLTLPTGALVTFIAMRLVGIPMNIMTIAGITIAFGTMVDASICMVENAHRRLGEGIDRATAIREACVEVGPGLFASLLVVTFSNLPLFALEEQAGRMFKPLALTNTIAMAASCVLSVTLIPALVSLLVRGRILSEAENPLSRLMIRLYAPVVRWSSKARWAVTLGAVAVSVLMLAPWRHLGNEFMPPLEEGDLLYMPTSVPGLGIGEARRALQTQDRILITFPEVKGVLGKIGRSSSATDPAPLEMVETTAQLYDEESWPVRSIPKGWIERRARAMLAGAGLDASLSGPVESMTRADVNDWIRERLARERWSVADSPGGEERWEEVRLALEPQTLRAMAPTIASKVDELLVRDALSMLTAKGQVPPAEREALRTRLARWLGSHPAGPAPLRRVTFEELTREEMQRAISQPGMPNWFLMPIQTRIGMITTGMRGYLGLKVFGTNYERVEKLAVDLERVLTQEVAGTVSAVAERAATGGTYLDVKIDRAACARYGVSIGEVEMVIQTAIGGMPVTETVEARYRFPVSVRYPRERRDDVEKLKRILVRIPGSGRSAGPMGTATALPDVVTLGQLASFEITRGPMVVKSDNNLLVVYLPVEFEGVSLGEYVDRAQKAIEKAGREGRLEIPPGYTTKWSGQYEIMERTNRRLLLILPVTLVIITVVLFLHFRRMSQTLIVLGGTLLFAPAGAIWLTYLLGYNVSTAWWLGMILLLGVAAETGVIMLVYIDNAYEDLLKKHGRMTKKLLAQAIEDGATHRVRPKVMTVAVNLFGLAPLLWATGAGAATVQRMAAPQLGGMATSLLLTLVVIPALYRIVRGWGLSEE